MGYGELQIYPYLDEIDLEDPELEEKEPKKAGSGVLFIQAPYGGDAIQFRGEPTSLLYAISVFADRVHKGGVRGLGDGNLGIMNPPVYDQEFISEFKNYLYNEKPKVIGISCTTSSSEPARELARIAKEISGELGYEIITVLGGAHERDMASMQEGSTSAEGLQRDNPVDLSATGESEESFDSLLQMIFEQNPEELAKFSAEELKKMLSSDKVRQQFAALRGRDGGFTFRLDGTLENIGTSGEPVDLDSLPNLPRHLIDEKSAKYYGIFRKAAEDVKTAQIMTCRGCLGGCEFCSEHRRFNPASAEKVIREIEDVVAQGYKAIFFDDSTFTWFHKHRKEEEVDKIFQVLGEKGLEWGCQTRADKLDKAIIDKMKEAGCTYIYMGLESADPKLLEAMHKGETIDRIEEAIDLVDAADIRIGMSLVFGTQGRARNGDEVRESKESIDKTLAFVRRKLDQGTNISLVSVNLLTYYPDSQVSKHMSHEQKVRLARESFPMRGGLDDLPDSELMKLAFERPIVRRGYPWNRFEDGQGHHPECITEELARYIVERGVEEIGEVIQGQDLHMVPEVYEGIRHGRTQEYVDFNHASLTTPRLTREQMRYKDDLYYRLPENKDEYREQPLDALWNERCSLDTYDKARAYAADILGLPHDNDHRLRHIVLSPNTTEAENIALMMALLTDENLDPEKPFRAVCTDAENFSIMKILKKFDDYSNRDGRDEWSSYQDYGVANREHEIETKSFKLKAEVAVAEVLGAENPEDEIVGKVTPETNIVIFSHVMRDNGRVVDAGEVCRRIREISPDCWILVDGAQAFGALPPFDVRGIACDFYVGTPHKTLNSFPFGVMYMADRATSSTQQFIDKMYSEKYSSPYRDGMFAEAYDLHGYREQYGIEEFDWERHEYLSPYEIRSFNAQFEPDVLGESLSPEEEAQQHEGVRLGRFDGMQTIPGKVIKKIESLEAHRTALRSYTLEKLEENFGDHIEFDNQGRHSNFIFSFKFSEGDNRQLADHLWRQEKPITISYIARTNNLRISFNQFNTEADIDFLIDSLKAAMAKEEEKQMART